MKYYGDYSKTVEGCIFPIEKYLKWEEDTYDVLGSVFLEDLKDSIDPESEINVREDECRFDNISHKCMGNADYWWLLMEYNGHIDWNLFGNEKLKIPDLNQLFIFEQQLLIKKNLYDMGNGGL